MSMFCFQCEQTAGGKGCTAAGVCGKTERTAKLQDELIGKLVALARLVAEKGATERSDSLVVEGLVAAVTNVNFDDGRISALTDAAAAYIAYADFDMDQLWHSADVDARSLKSLLLFGLKGMAAFAHQAAELGATSRRVHDFLYRGLVAIGEDHAANELLDLSGELGKVNLECLALLDEANTRFYGNPSPTTVSLHIEPGPFIVVSGHDLCVLAELLEQTAGAGVNVYTHGEMVSAHGYPALRKHAHLKGNFGGPRQNQRRDFDGLPAPILFTADCLMPPLDSYVDRIFTTGAAGYPGSVHIASSDGKRDFLPLVERAKALGGYPEGRRMTGINGGTEVTTGYGHASVLSSVDRMVAAVKSGRIRRFLVVGGCDGARLGRDYYTEFVKHAPPDTVVLTLACGKYRFNDLDLGAVEGIPRLMDLGQCGDAYGAIQVAYALADAFKCNVNDLPLSVVLSWYAEKSVCILLTLLSLGIRHIYLGPSLAAFVSTNVRRTLGERWKVTQISTPEDDLKKILR